MVEMGDLFAQQEVFQQARATDAGLQRVLVVADLDALIVGHGVAGLDRLPLQVLDLVGVAVGGAVIHLVGGLTGGPRDRRGGDVLFGRVHLGSRQLQLNRCVT